tara:strand:- start:272 stop:493 length:222 start_codon:yes stop_codon:yes gene_type:complete
MKTETIPRMDKHFKMTIVAIYCLGFCRRERREWYARPPASATSNISFFVKRFSVVSTTEEKKATIDKRINDTI